MPTYQYACTECGHGFEAVQSFTDDALTECPRCTGRLRKVFNSVGVVFKGSGFYRTDSREASKASGNGKGESKPAEGKPAEKKAEAPAKGDGGSTSSTSSSTTSATSAGSAA